MHPNSLEALAKAQQARKKGEGVRQISVCLTKEAIATLDEAAQTQGISRSELIERYAAQLKEATDRPQ